MITLLRCILGGFIVIGGIETLHVFAHTIFRGQFPQRACVSPLTFERFFISFILITILYVAVAASGGEVATVLLSNECALRRIKAFKEEQRKQKRETKCLRNGECSWFGLVKSL